MHQKTSRIGKEKRMQGTYTHAVITGGSSGIGLAAAGVLVSSGCTVLLVSRDARKLQNASEILSAQGGAERVSTLQLDVTDRTAVQRELAPVCEKQPPDFVMNSAGMTFPGYFSLTDSDVFDQVLSTNLTGCWNVLKTVVPFMERGSSIVNVSSLAGLVGTFGYTAYSASKFALVGLSEALRSELVHRGIRVHVLCPPDTDTPMLEEENRTKPPETRALSGSAGVMSAEAVAAAMFRGMRRGHFMIVPSMQGAMVYLLKRLLPGLVYRAADSIVRKSTVENT